MSSRHISITAVEKARADCSQSPISKNLGLSNGEQPTKNPSFHTGKSGQTLPLFQVGKAIPKKYMCTFQPSGVALAGVRVCGQTFTRMADCKRHFKKHFPVLRIFPCLVPGCDKIGDNAFYRHDKLLDHERTRHI